MIATPGRRSGRLAGTDPTADALRAFLKTDLTGVLSREDAGTRWHTRTPVKRPSPAAKL